MYHFSLQHSWKYFIYTRCQNVNRKGPAPGVPRLKREKNFRGLTSFHTCMPPNADDDVSSQRNLELLDDELRKSKPRPEVVKQLLKRTFAIRWEKFIDDENATLSDYLEKYSVLTKASYVSYNSSVHIHTVATIYTLVYSPIL